MGPMQSFGVGKIGLMPYTSNGQAYMQNGNHDGVISHTLPNHSADNLGQAFNNLNVGALNTSGHLGHNLSSYGGNLVSNGPVTQANGNGGMYYSLGNGRFVFANGNQAPQAANNPGYPLNSSNPQYLQQTGYQLSQPLSASVTPPGQGWMMARQPSSEVPELSGPRRSSWSSNEENGPHTPFFSATSQGAFQPGIITEQSPNIWSTTPPADLHQGFVNLPTPLAKCADGNYQVMDLDSMCQKHPAIPRPIPAIFSGEKGRGTLEKSLKNDVGTTNVYIRGLPPNTTDEMLHSYGARFGEIDSAKSMLDQHTGACKGFGFIKYHNFTDGENCIRGFFHWGYEAKWARQSHNERLKTLSDRNNTNLYVSNLPADTNECALKALFAEKGFACISSKILRDPNGLSRGVGFARFETPEVCEDVIATYSGAAIGEEGAVLNIRYADTPEQKQLKSSTAQSRQFKTNEYNTAVYGTSSPYNASPVQANFPSPLQVRLPSNVPSPYWQNTSPISPLYQGYPQGPGPNQSQLPPIGSYRNYNENVTPAPLRTNSRVKIESPSVVALAKRTSGQTIGSSPLASADSDGTPAKVEIRAPSLHSAKSTPSKRSA
ncbi:hypothetical protein MMC25_007031 [Agyrium rufum]|nr:hypothetical protein [Agyrium rufum]